MRISRYFLSTIILAGMLSLASHSLEANAAQLHMIDSKAFTKVLEERKENKIVFFFTSWCSYCKRTISDLLINPNLNKVVFVSIDKDYNGARNIANAIPQNIDIYYLMTPQSVVNVFTKFNMQYNNAIPYIVALGPNNEIVKDNLNSRQLQKYLK